jgi:hypothetical protein
MCLCYGHCHKQVPCRTSALRKHPTDKLQKQGGGGSEDLQTTSDKGLRPKIYKELESLNNPKNLLKWAISIDLSQNETYK